MKSHLLFPGRALAALLIVTLCGVPQVAAQAAAQSPQQEPVTQQEPVPQQPASAPPATGNDAPEPDAGEPQAQHAQPPASTSPTVDPSQGPLEPVPSSTLPDAPSAVQGDAAVAPQTETATPVPPQTTAPVPAAQQPVGAAAAERGRTVGGAASKPAGTAIAPDKQKQKWSLLLKLGAIAGVGVAVGTVMALSKGTPSVPPGATR